jgi:hypothetical protein
MALRWWPLDRASFRVDDTQQNVERVARAICRARGADEGLWPHHYDEAREFLLCFAALVNLEVRS